MALRKSVCILMFVVLSLIALTSGFPSKEKSKIRIHIPVKHHTHVHTKTIIKKVPVPVPVPVKEHVPIIKEYVPKKEVKYEVEEDDEDELEGYHYSKSNYAKKKRRVHHPFI